MTTNGTTQRKAERCNKFERHKGVMRRAEAVCFYNLQWQNKDQTDLGSGSFR